MAFYSNVPGYYASGSTGSQQEPRLTRGIPDQFSATTLGNKMERLGAGLIWNGVSTSNVPNKPVLFLTALDPWSTANYASTSTLDIVGPNVFRFEYYYLLKNGNVSSTPWYTGSTVSGMQDVAAIVADIAVVDPKSRGLLTNAQVTTLAGTLSDYNGQAPGVLLSNWRTAIDTNTNACRARHFPVFDFTNVFFTSPRQPSTHHERFLPFSRCRV